MFLQTTIGTAASGLGVIVLGAALNGTMPHDDVRSGYCERPAHTHPANADVKENSVYLFENRGFHDDFVPMMDITTNRPGQVHEFDAEYADRLSSVRWNLPAGVVLLLQEDADGTGEQIALWGNGQIETFDPWDFGDKASSWSWYYVGGGDSNDAQVTAGMLPAPGCTTLTNGETVDDMTVQFFQDKDFKGEFVPANILEAPAAKLQKLPGRITDRLTSMKWKLPEGVVVALYQDASGKGQQVTIWGNGEISDIDTWDFNDKVSRWAWYYIGEKPAETPDRE